MTSSAGAGAGRANRVLLHVGAPKTGTSFVQDLLFRHRESLREQGVLYPADRFDAHFLAALDLMELPWGGLEHEAVGAWDRLAGQVRDFPGTSIVSHEILARATPESIARALASFGDREIHVVVSARDLVRQIPAEWQENVKHRRTMDYASFLRRIMDPARNSELATWFWGVQEIPDILARWGDPIDPAHVHLVTVPPPGAPRGLLWERFASVFGLDPAAYDTEEVRANPSLGVPETDYVRRINVRVNDGVLTNERYREFVRELLAHRTLSARTGSPRLSVPADVHAWAAELSQQWLDGIAQRGYDVVGALDDLLPGEPTEKFVDPDLPALDDAVALDATVALLVEAARLRGETEELRAELGRALAERDRALDAQPWYRFKRGVVRRSGSSRLLRAGLRVYRWARHRR